ncbi:MAG: hypothetical protein JW863_11340, partial [Chitinispirillaceae bacterium]|nr:hypothetical protein [Chitinispirillaceae bacterium]
LTYDHTTTHDWGVFIFGATYSPGLFYLQTATERWDDDLGRLVAEKHRFTGARASPASSRNDMGVISPDYFSFHAYGGIKHPRLTHSFGLNGSIPLGKAFYTEYDYVITPKNNALISSFPTGGTPLLEDYGFQLPDDTLSYHFTQSDSVWVVREEIRKKEDRWFTLTPIYGLEIYNDFLPLFLALSLPVEFNGKTGVGVKGFTLELGMKLGVY